MLEDDYLVEEGSNMNFERATLKIKEDNEISSTVDNTRRDDSVNQRNTETTQNKILKSRHISNIPFKAIDVHNYFSDRQEVLERAVRDCRKELVANDQEDPLGIWLLTEISIWDTEKERLVLLTKDTLYSVKYDFISLKILDYTRVPLMDVDTIIAGDLIYPSKSILPRLRGLAEGISSIIHCAIRQEWSSFTSSSASLSQFEPRNRNIFGLRIMWNKGNPLSFDKKWNPFTKNIPWITYTSHPLYWHKASRSEKTQYDVKDLHGTLLSLVPKNCSKLEKYIVIENYLGIGSFIYNRNSLGFFKIRGKISF